MASPIFKLEKSGAVYQIKQSLREWSVDPSQSKKHRSFYNSIVAAVEDCFVGKSENNTGGGRRNGSGSPGNASFLPGDEHDVLEAVEMVLKSHLRCTKQSSCCLDDRLKLNYQPPYKVDRRGKEFISRKRWAFRDVPPGDLDPFQRFAPKPYEKAHYFYKKWIEDQDERVVQERVLAAIVASHAIRNEKCPQCCSKGLRWDVFDGEPWVQTMYCTSCESVFDIKCKSETETIQGMTVFVGRPLPEYHRLRLQRRKEGWRHYVIVVNNKPSYEDMDGEQSRTKHLCWVVELLEIENIRLQLDYSVFGSNDIDLAESITCSITAKHAKHEWLKVPFVEVNYKPILEQILTEEFPDKLKLDDNGDAKLPLTCSENSLTGAKAGLSKRAQTLSLEDRDKLRWKLDRLSLTSFWDDVSDEEE
jgi:hypothetical protein